jgi:N-acetylglucosaminyldiphosphoundecaprenol N-acetyl-beta-D-mannosaminyltransferase
MKAMAQHQFMQPGTFERSASTPNRATDILGTQINAVTMQSTIATIEDWIARDDPHYVCICTVNTIVEGRNDPGFQRVVNGAGLRTPDGMPLVFLSKRAGNTDVSRVYGPDLMLELCARSAQTGHRHFFYGGAEGVAETLADRLSSRFPGLQVAGTISPPMLKVGEIEKPETIQAINEARPDIVWVGLNTPKQDWWVANHRPLLHAPVLIAVGAAFDFHSGRIRQAPSWVQQCGFEWLFRLSQDPRRLWKRYVIGNSTFIAAILREHPRLIMNSQKTEGVLPLMREESQEATAAASG